MAGEQLGFAEQGGEAEQLRRRPSRGMYLLPSLFTAGNIGAGYYAITQAIQGTATNHAGFDHAALAIGLAALLDGVDGFIARLTNTASDFGRELDSLADVITFGVAPCLLAYLWGFTMLPATAYPTLRDNVLHGGLLVCFLFLICGASRLARFNIAVNPQPRNPGKPGKKFFVGMPIPAGAGVIAAVVHCFDGSPIYNAWTSVVWLVLILFSSFLMVSNWRFWSAKEITSGKRQPFQLFALIALMGALIAWKSEWMLMVIAMGYLVSGVFARLAYSWGRQRRHAPGPGMMQR
ncbi:MAG TPA: CDP-diacylglycerol--serine O-phosphatidyltransferase [Acidobacteriaceae bacterium]|nr:CDP-diacylglycerol--serine O-phosphatidyltransferase [Acidobacteriaceae bacterium]